MAGLDDLYQAIILDHAKRRDGEGEIERPTATHHERNPTCGDEIDLSIRVEHGTITALGWQGQGCSISQASASVLAGMVPGTSVDDAQGLVDAMRTMLRSGKDAVGDEQVLGDGAAFAGVAVFPMRVKCAMLPWVALEADLRLASAAD